MDNSEMLECANCGKLNPKEVLFCGKCGSKLQHPVVANSEKAEDEVSCVPKCWKCGSMMPKSAVFCGVCGNKLDSGTEKERDGGPNSEPGVSKATIGVTSEGEPAKLSDTRSAGAADAASKGIAHPKERKESAPGVSAGVEPTRPEPPRPEGSIREMVLIPDGKFPIGSDGLEGNQDERPRHLVELSAFFIDRFAVSNAEYEQHDPGHISLRADSESRSGDPVVFVSYADCEAYCRWRCKQEGVSEGTYRLPTEAQWEVAARGGLPGQVYPWGDEINSALCNTREGRRGRALSVGEGVPNGYGLLHMGDNIREWCLDWYVANYYECLEASGRNPSGPSGSSFGNRLRVVRGASYQDSANQLGRCAARNYGHPRSSSNDTGFRCVRLLGV